MFDQEKKMTQHIAINGDPGEKAVPAFYFFLLAGTACKTPGQNHTVINTSIKQCSNVRYLCRLHRRLYKDSPQMSKSGLRYITGMDVQDGVMMRI